MSLESISSLVSGERFLIENDQLIIKKKSEMSFRERILAPIRLSSVLGRIQSITAKALSSGQELKIEGDLTNLKKCVKRIRESFKHQPWFLRLFFGAKVDRQCSEIIEMIHQHKLENLHGESLANSTIFCALKIKTKIQIFLLHQKEAPHNHPLNLASNNSEVNSLELFRAFRAFYQFLARDDLGLTPWQVQAIFHEVTELETCNLRSFAIDFVEERWVDELTQDEELAAFLSLFYRFPFKLKLINQNIDSSREQQIEQWTHRFLKKWDLFFGCEGRRIRLTSSLIDLEIVALMLKTLCEDKSLTPDILLKRLEYFYYDHVLDHFFSLNPNLNAEWLTPLTNFRYAEESMIGNGLLGEAPREKRKELYLKNPIPRLTDNRQPKPNVNQIFRVLSFLAKPEVMQTFSDQEFKELIGNVLAWRPLPKLIYIPEFFSSIDGQKSKLEILKKIVLQRTEVDPKMIIKRYICNESLNSLREHTGCVSALFVVQALHTAFQTPREWENCMRVLGEDLDEHHDPQRFHYLFLYLEILETEGVLTDSLIKGLSRHKFFIDMIRLRAFLDSCPSFPRCLTRDKRGVGVLRRYLNLLDPNRIEFLYQLKLTFNQRRLLRAAAFHLNAEVDD
jgi:hypothetical protein